jgi:hypothetical protein
VRDLPLLPLDATVPEGGDDTSHAVLAAQCKRVSALVALLGSRHERVQQRAVQRLAELGPSVAGVLRTVCRSRTPSRGDAVAGLAEIGWHELDRVQHKQKLDTIHGGCSPSLTPRSTRE